MFTAVPEQPCEVHILEDGDVPGWPVRCMVCGRSWRTPTGRRHLPRSAARVARLRAALAPIRGVAVLEEHPELVALLARLVEELAAETAELRARGGRGEQPCLRTLLALLDALGIDRGELPEIERMHSTD